MEAGYDIYESSNVYIEAFRESMPLVFTAVLLYLYYRKRISVLETVLYAFATEAYTLLAIGPTFSATFFISIFFFLEQVHLVLKGKFFINKRYLLLLMLPLLSSVAVFFIVQVYKDPFYYPGGSPTSFYMRPLYFYIKNYLPIFSIGARILQDREQLSFEHFSEVMRRIAGISCVIALVQLMSQYVFRSVELGEILGLQRRYLQTHAGDVFSARIQAWFSEPKTFSAFISLVVPLYLHEKKYKMAAVLLLLGVLTLSQTFWINMFSGLLIFVCYTIIRNVRVKILAALATIIGLFVVIAGAREFFFKQYTANQHNAAYQLLLKRSVYRYDSEIWGKNNVVLGMPLQRDLELPVVEFLRDERYLLVSGYGPGNSTFIPAHYFFGQLNYANRVSGIGGINLNMRWFYIMAEFGCISLLIFFFVLTQTSPAITAFQKNYFAYIWVCFFFCQIDLFLMIMALLSAPGDSETSTI